MDSSILLSTVRSILIDAVEQLDINAISSMSYTKIERLKSFAIYFHSHRCVSALMKLNKHNQWRSFHYETAVLSDNSKFFEDNMDLLLNYNLSTRLQLYREAQLRGSDKIYSTLKNTIPSRNNPPTKRIQFGKYHFSLEASKRSYQQLQAMWEMDSMEYDNIIQWLPREMLEDLLEQLICNMAQNITDI